jgi:translocator protein
VAISFLASAPGAWFSPGDWYAGLDKPAWNPPGWLFGPVWTVLYAAMGVSAWLVWRCGRDSRSALAPFFVQLALNAAWTPVFFGMHEMGWAFAVILALWLAIAVTIAVFARHSRPAALLLLPYLAWVTFAAALNFSLWRLN